MTPLPCPFCSGRAEYKEGIKTGYVMCLKCEVMGPNLPEGEAVAAWNERSQYVPQPIWRPHTEKPNVPDATTALLAILDDENGEPMLAGIYLWRKGQWVSEETFKPCDTPFWWTLEDELAGTVPQGGKNA